MTPEQQQLKEKARVAVALTATTSEAPLASPPPPPRRQPRNRFSSVFFAGGGAPASSRPPTKPAASAAADALRFYARTLPTTLVVVAVMFGLYAATSYGLPHVLCKDSARDETIVDTYSSFHRCVYNYDTDYSKNRSRKIFLVFYHACTLTWLASAVVINGLAMWPATTRGKAAKIGALAVLGCFSVALATPALGLPLNSKHHHFTIPYLFGLTTNLVIGRALVESTGDPIDQARFFVIEFFAGTICLIYNLFMQRVVTRRAFGKPIQLLATRLVFHTLSWYVVDIAFQHLGRYIVNTRGRGRREKSDGDENEKTKEPLDLKTPAMSLSVLFVLPSMYRGVYGRFLLSQLDTAGNVAVLNVALALVGLAARVASRPTAGTLLAKMYGGDRVAQAAEASGALGEIRAAKRYMDFLAEITGIVCAASVYTFGVVSPDGVSSYPVKAIWLSALYQAITAVVAEAIALVIDAVFHGVDYEKSWPLTRKGALTFCGWLLLIALVGGSRICFDILILFCPSVDAEGKEMMSFCNAPSLFDRL